MKIIAMSLKQKEEELHPRYSPLDSVIISDTVINTHCDIDITLYITVAQLAFNAHSTCADQGSKH